MQTSFVNLWYVVDDLSGTFDVLNGVFDAVCEFVVVVHGEDDVIDVVVTLDGKDDDVIDWVVVVQGDLEMILVVVMVLFSGIVVE